MFTSKDKLAIVLTSEHLSMASVRSGKIVHAERVDLDPERWDEAWIGGLHMLDQPLRQLIARFGGFRKSMHAELFYSSPGSVCRVDITDMDEATSIAKMECGLKQSIGQSNPVNAACLNSLGHSCLTVGIADDESNLQRLYAWLNRSRIKVDRMIPSRAIGVQQAMTEASAVEEGTAILYVSSQSSVIGYFEEGNPKLARLIEIGYGKLSDAYSRYMLEQSEQANCGEVAGEDCLSRQLTKTGNDQDKSICNDRQLFTHGIPIGSTGVEGEFAGILPWMSPVLQRISIEIKQTFRFASSVNNLPSKLVICGPGAAIPMIGAALSQSLDLHVEVIPDSKDYKPAEVFGVGTSSMAAACGQIQNIELLPGAAKELIKRSTLNRSLKIGAAVAIAMIGGQYYFTTRQSAMVARTISKQSHVIDRIELDQHRRESIRVMAGSVGTAAVLIEDTMGQRVEWVEFLGSIPNDDHELIRVSGLQGRMNAQYPIVSLSGIAIAESEDVDASQILSRYIKALREMPEVNRIEIGSTSRSLFDESSWGLKFNLSIEISSEAGEFSDLMTLCNAGRGESP